MNAKIPNEIIKAIDILLAPYDINLEQLLECANEQRDCDPQLYIEVKVATAVFNCSRSTLYRAARRGDIEVSKLSEAQSGKVLIEKRSLVYWLKSKKKYYV